MKNNRSFGSVICGIMERRGSEMKNGMRVIDTEHHFDFKLMRDAWKNSMTPEEWQLSGSADRYDYADEAAKKLISLIEDLGALRLGVMDESGIDFAQISLTTPGAEYFEPEIGKKIAGTYNTMLMAAIAEHPDRFGAYMALCPEDVEWSLAEIDRCAEGGMFGLSILSNFNGKYLDEPKYFPILEKLAAYKMPVYLHPNFCTWKEFKEFGYCLNGPSLGFTADTQLAYMRLIHRGVFDKLPDLKVILGHDCEGMGFFKNRMDTAWRQGYGQPNSGIGVTLQHEPSFYLDKNTWGTTSGNYSQIALRATVDAMGKEKVMLATDAFYEDIKGMVDFIGDNKELSQEEKECLLFKNAEALGFGVNHKK